jgi:Spy/CpxP family protein refolding chaperone
MRLCLLVAVLLAAASAAPAAEQQPYAGLHERPISAMSAEEIDALTNGLGFSQALAAELNGYPGPRHVLDLADQLGLDDEREAVISALFDEMKVEAIAAGQAVLTAEADFDALFHEGGPSEDEVMSAAEEIGRLRGILRGIHLRYHLQTTALLTPHQIALYNAARGYAGGGAAHGGHGAHTAQ